MLCPLFGGKGNCKKTKKEYKRVEVRLFGWFSVLLVLKCKNYGCRVCL